MDMTYGITSEVKWSLLQCTYNVLLSILSPPPPPKKKGPIQEDLAVGVQEDLIPNQVPVLNHEIAGLMIFQVLSINPLPKDWLLCGHQNDFLPFGTL